MNATKSKRASLVALQQMWCFAIRIKWFKVISIFENRVRLSKVYFF